MGSGWLVGALAGPVYAPASALPAVPWQAECASWLQAPAVRHSLQLVRARLQSQGLQLDPQGCPFVQTGAGQMQQVLDLRVVVRDSEAAADFVRGPLADGEAVDMGDVRLYSAGASDDVSPDVAHNRRWLAQLLQSHGWQGVAGHWWAFVPAPQR